MAAGDITAVRIASATSYNGFIAEIDIDTGGSMAIGGTYATGIGSDNDPSAAKVVLTVTSNGFTNSGGATTYNRTVYGVPCRQPSATPTIGARKAFPDQATADESVVSNTLTIRLALSDDIYADDTVTAVITAGLYTSGTATASYSGAVTNNSTLAHPKVIGRWAVVPYQRVTADFLLEAVCFHRSVKNGKPVACVVFEATDGTNTVSATVTEMTVSATDGVGNAADNKVLVYATTLSTSTLNQGAVITCNFKAYPWIGDSGATLDSRTTADGFAQPDERLGPLALLCDKTGAYAGGVAVVDATNGQASTANTWVYADQSTAESTYAGGTTNSYNTIGRAIQAIKSYNNANLSRDTPSGGTILISGVGTINWPGTVPGVNQGTQDTYLTITRLSSVSRATAVINAVGSDDAETQKVKFEDVTLFSSTGSVRISGDDSAVDVLWVHNCTLDLTTTSAPPFLFWKTAYATRNTVTALTGGFMWSGAVRAAWALVRGNAGPTSALATKIIATEYCFLGNYNLAPRVQPTGNAAGHQISDNSIVAFNSTYGTDVTTGPWHSNPGAATAVSHGRAYIQNLVETVTSAGIGSWAITPDDEGVAHTHILIWHNTFISARLGVAYNWTVNVFHLKSNYAQRCNLYREYANKDDSTATGNANRTGCWAVGYGVGNWANHHFTEDSNDMEFVGLYGVTGGTLAFVNDASKSNDGSGGSNAGNGDYHLTPSASAYALVPAGYAVLPYDLEGTPRNLAGGSAGAFESNIPALSVALMDPVIGASLF